MESAWIAPAQDLCAQSEKSSRPPQAVLIQQRRTDHPGVVYGRAANLKGAYGTVPVVTGIPICNPKMVPLKPDVYMNCCKNPCTLPGKAKGGRTADVNPAANRAAPDMR